MPLQTVTDTLAAAAVAVAVACVRARGASEGRLPPRLGAIEK